MTVSLADMVQESSTTTGAGPFTLDGAVAGYQSFATVTDGALVGYRISEVDSSGNPSGQFETGRGTKTGVTLARTSPSTVSPGSANPVVFAAGPKRVFCTLIAADILAASNNLSELTSASAARGSLGGTTVGQAVFTLVNPGAVTYPQFNADNSVTALSASGLRSAIGAGTGSGTVTAVSVATANGVSGTSSGGATPALTIALGSITPTSLTTQTISVTALNAGPLPTSLSGTIARLAAADGVGTRMLFDSFGTGLNNNLSFRQASGTAAAPSAIALDDIIMSLTSFAYGTSAYTASSRATIKTIAAELWTNSAQGTYITFATTAIGGTTTVEKVRITPTGGLNVGGTADVPLGGIVATTVNGLTFTASTGTLTLNTFTLTVAATASVSGTNTGDQTNISGNAATVTTNANLTGPITSTGNATAVAAQTGTGTTFVMQTSPTLTTPNIGDATGNTFTIGTSCRVQQFGLYVRLDGGLFWQNNLINPDTSLTRTAGNVVKFGDGQGGIGWFTYAGVQRVTGDVTNATATMSNITGLSVTLIAGRKYVGQMIVYASNSQASEGLQFDFNGGTVTATSFVAGVVGTPVGATIGTAYVTALATALTVTTATTGDIAYLVTFEIVVNAGGTFIVRFAEVSHLVGTATVRLGSYMMLNDSPN